MRHAGSGTHATLEDGVFRGDGPTYVQSSTPATGWIPFDPSGCPTYGDAQDPQGPNNPVWHYRSSTDLTEDCVQYYDGAVGYVDGDKVLANDFVDNVHQVKFQSVEPTRDKIKFGEYVYWSAQACYYDDDTVNGTVQDLADDLMAFAASAQNLAYGPFGEKANFWATGAEMTVQKGTADAYPQKN
jgi:hypothetical protein